MNLRISMWRKPGEAAARLLGCGLLSFCALQAFLLAQQAAVPTPPPAKIYVKLRLDGLYPKSLTAQPGRCEIIFTNAAFLKPFDVFLENGNGQNVAQTASGGKFRHRQSLKTELQPGRYQIQVVGHPSWAADLLVTPKGK